jgi:hypothetical protein
MSKAEQIMEEEKVHELVFLIDSLIEIEEKLKCSITKLIEKLKNRTMTIKELKQILGVGAIVGDGEYFIPPEERGSIFLSKYGLQRSMQLCEIALIEGYSYFVGEEQI